MRDSDGRNGKGFDSVRPGLSGVKVDADKDGTGVFIGDGDAVGQCDEDIAVAGHDDAVAFFLEDVPHQSRELEGVFFFVFKISSAARIFASVPSVEHDGIETPGP